MLEKSVNCVPYNYIINPPENQDRWDKKMEEKGGTERERPKGKGRRKGDATNNLSS